MYHFSENFEVQVFIDDDLEDDTRSECEGSVASSTISLRPSLRSYHEENGRTYHHYKEGKYNIPNDDKELDRQDLEHHLWLLTLDDRLGLAPPCQPNANVGRVLDVGTGTGIWAMNYGEEHPQVRVYGNDLSPVQPDHTPPNVRFEVDDVEDEWTFSRPFDYIHSRVMTSSISDWSLYLRRCFDNLEPGGYLELQELDCVPRSDDGTLTPQSPLMKWADLLVEASEKCGRPYIRIPPLKDLMVEIGFEDVCIYMHKWPTNSWPKDPKFKELGMWQNQSMMEGLDGFTMAPLTRALKWKKDEVNVFLIDVRKEINNRDVHAYWPIYFIMGRKPLKTDENKKPDSSNFAFTFECKGGV
ncbi:putative methyltransferase tdiE [Colletotrichum siamense]|nr:putative methyltransferase tdiE [Colletotrichum siamense]KAF4875145.1 putative methyltransferase tdiE [Colletotrichum siamense]